MVTAKRDAASHIAVRKGCVHVNIRFRAARSAWEWLFSEYHVILLLNTGRPLPKMSLSILMHLLAENTSVVVTNSRYFCFYITLRGGDSNDGITVVVHRTSFKIFNLNGKGAFLKLQAVVGSRILNK